MEETKVRVLPADVYDALELSALEFGGIGGGSVRVWTPDRDQPKAPLCVLGHAAHINGIDPYNTPQCEFAVIGTEVGTALEQAFGSLSKAVTANDAVAPLASVRMPFETWCAKLNVVRGDQ